MIYEVLRTPGALDMVKNWILGSPGALDTVKYEVSGLWVPQTL